MEVQRGLLIVVSAPSGAGKTTICREVLNSCLGLTYSISYTTRPIRPGEVNGTDYFFVSEQEFKRKIEAGEFLEWTKKFGYLYGTATETIQDSLTRGADLLLDIDTEGARNLKKVLPDAVFVFILPPSLEELRRRLENRGSECEDSIGIRLNKAGEEIKEVFWYDYIIINEKIGEGVEQLKSIYLAEKNKRNRKISEVKKRFNLEEKINYGKNNC